MTEKEIQERRAMHVKTMDTLRGLANEQDDILDVLLKDYDALECKARVLAELEAWFEKLPNDNVNIKLVLAKIAELRGKEK